MYLCLVFLCLLGFLNCSHSQLWGILEGQPYQSDVNHCVCTILTQGHREPRNEVGSLSPAERLVGFEPKTFRF